MFNRNKFKFIYPGNCGSCGISIDGEASVVGEIHFHPKCFVCADCKNPLGTAKYYIIGGKNYCEQCRYVSKQLFYHNLIDVKKHLNFCFFCFDEGQIFFF